MGRKPTGFRIEDLPTPADDAALPHPDPFAPARKKARRHVTPGLCGVCLEGSVSESPRTETRRSAGTDHSGRGRFPIATDVCVMLCHHALCLVRSEPGFDRRRSLFRRGHLVNPGTRGEVRDTGADYYERQSRVWCCRGTAGDCLRPSGATGRAFEQMANEGLP